MRFTALLLTATAAFAMAGCDRKIVTINASVDGNDSAADGSTVKTEGDNLSIKLPGFDANIKMPGGVLAGTKFDIDGVKLYPGAKVTTMNVTAHEGSPSGVRIAFAAPDDVGKVRAWFAKSFADRNVAIVPAGNGLAGKTADGDRITMQFAPAQHGSTGTVDIVDHN